MKRFYDETKKNQKNQNIPLIIIVIKKLLGLEISKKRTITFDAVSVSYEMN